MKALKRSLAVGGVLAIVGASVVMGMGSAQAAAGITVSPHTNIKNGQAVKVVGHGYTPGAQIAMGECPKGVTASGPGYCASQTSGGSYLAVAKPDGTVSQTLYMTVGPLHNTSGAPATCDATHPCLIEVENISKHSEYAAVELQFAGAAKAARRRLRRRTHSTSRVDAERIRHDDRSACDNAAAHRRERRRHHGAHRIRSAADRSGRGSSSDAFSAASLTPLTT